MSTNGKCFIQNFDHKRELTETIVPPKKMASYYPLEGLDGTLLPKW